MGKILVIDDERPIRRTLCEILEFEKFEVDQAENGEDGLKMAQENEYDVILCEPNFREYKNFKIDTPNNTVLKSDILVFLVGHKEFKNIKTSHKKVFDFCGILADE